MKKYFLLLSLSGLLLSNSECSKKNTTATRYKGKLEIAGICMNYTIRLIEGKIDTSLIMADWVDESTNIAYTNVFRLGNPCDFPASIKQGDEFYFFLFTGKGNQCAVCMAYYPTPPKAVSIKIED
jgi:hypothetical protein